MMDRFPDTGFTGVLNRQRDRIAPAVSRRNDDPPISRITHAHV